MCLQDWKLGRLIRTRSFLITGGVGTVQCAAPNPQRVYLRFNSMSSNAGAEIRMTGDDGVSGSVAQLITGNLDWVEFTAAINGDMCTKRFDLAGSLAATSVFVTEGYLPEGVLSELPDSLLAKGKK